MMDPVPEEEYRNDHPRSSISKTLFPFCHKDIATILAGPIIAHDAESSANDMRLTLPGILQQFETTFGFPNQQQQQEEESLEENALIQLAQACDSLYFGSSSSSSPSCRETTNDLFLSKLIEEVRSSSCDSGATETATATTTDRIVSSSDSATTTVATLLALNVLETSIRNTLVYYKEEQEIKSKAPSKTTSKANNHKQQQGKKGSPLLKDMIRHLSHLAGDEENEESLSTAALRMPKYIPTICRLFLLPKRQLQQHRIDHAVDDKCIESINQNDEYDDERDGLLNFRNLVWHGFVPNVPRPWFALTVFLIEELQKLNTSKHHYPLSNNDDSDPNNNTLVEVFDLASNPLYKSILLASSSQQYDCNHTDKLKARYRRIEQWINDTTSSQSYVDLWRLACMYMSIKLSPQSKSPPQPQRPATICAILSVLIEHTLRIEWCDVNNRPDDVQARHGYMYVTLDGHGQRTKHDLLISPYLSGDGTTTRRNRYLLLHRSSESMKSLHPTNDNDKDNDIVGLDGSSFAILSDLFCSPMGPNIRSAVSHGFWDQTIKQEWTGTTTTITKDKMDVHRPTTTTTTEQRLWDLVESIVVVMDHIAQTRARYDPDILTDDSTVLSRDIRPQFTYIEETSRQLDNACISLQNLRKIQTNSTQYSGRLVSAKAAIPNIPGEKDIMEGLAPFVNTDDVVMESLLKTILSYKSHWISPSRPYYYDVYFEYNENQRLESLGAIRVLLKEITSAMSSHVSRLTQALEFLCGDDDSGEAVMVVFTHRP